MKKSIYRQLVFLFIGIMICSNIISFLVSYNTVSHGLTTDIRDTGLLALDSARALYLRDKSTKDEIESLSSTGNIRVSIVDSVDELELTDEQREILATGESIVLQSGQIRSMFQELPFAVSEMDGEYGVAYLISDRVTLRSRMSTMQMIVIAIIIGSVVFLVVGRMIISPVKEITLATQKVAGGDFDIVIPNDRQDEIGTLIDNFNRMTKALGSIEMLRSDFISDISHEIKTPITSIEGYAKLLGDDTLTADERREFVDIITSETARLSAMSSNILTLNRLENDSFELSRTEFRLDELVRRVVLLIENRWSEKGLDLNIELAPIVFCGNEQLLHQVVLNLVDNAVKFSPQGGRLDLALSETETGVVLSVGDHGQGIAQEDVGRVFDKFFKSDRSRGGEGNGLGLSIVHKIVNMHGGAIEIRSKEGDGTTFYVFLPHKN